MKSMYMLMSSMVLLTSVVSAQLPTPQVSNNPTQIVLPAVTVPQFKFVPTESQLTTLISWTPTVESTSQIRIYRITVSRNGTVLSGYPKTVTTPFETVIGPQIPVGTSVRFIIDVRLIIGTVTSPAVSGRSTYTRVDAPPPIVSGLMSTVTERHDSVEFNFIWRPSEDVLGDATSYLLNFYSNKVVPNAGVTKETFDTRFNMKVKRPAAGDSVRLTVNVRPKRRNLLGPWRTIVISQITNPLTVPTGLLIYPDSVGLAARKLAVGDTVRMCAFVKFPDGKVAFRSTFESQHASCVAGYNLLPSAVRLVSPTQSSVANSMCVTWVSRDTTVAQFRNVATCP